MARLKARLDTNLPSGAKALFFQPQRGAEAPLYRYCHPQKQFSPNSHHAFCFGVGLKSCDDPLNSRSLHFATASLSEAMATVGMTVSLLPECLVLTHLLKACGAQKQQPSRLFPETVKPCSDSNRALKLCACFGSFRRFLRVSVVSPILGYGLAQSCQTSPFTRENSATFAVTRVNCRWIACPAMRTS